MARTGQNEQVIALNGGLDTDSSPLTRPKESTSYQENFKPLTNKTLARRFGIDLDASATTVSYILSPSVLGYTYGNYVKYVWQDAYDKEDICVILIDGQSLLYNRVDDDGTNITPQAASTVTNPNQFTSANRLLYVPLRLTSLAPLPEVQTTTFDGLNVAAFTDRRLYMRDVWGVDDGFAIDDRPLAATTKHMYNLLNQGWTVDAINQFNTDIGAYPSNADIPYFGTNSTGNYDANLLKQRPAIGGAPKGRFFVTLNRAGAERNNQSSAAMTALGIPQFSTLPEAPNDQRLSVVAAVAHSGRIFYLINREGYENHKPGTNDLMPDLQKYLLYSQSILNEPSTKTVYDGAEYTALSCHTLQSPTEEGFRQTVADGGILSITDVGELIKAVSVQDGLYILANNGVWLLRSVNGAFDPTQPYIAKVSNEGCINKHSVVEVQDNIMYATNKGLVMAYWDQEGNRPKTLDITFDRTNTLLLKWMTQIVDSTYDSVNGLVYWLVADESVAPTRQYEIVLKLKDSTMYLNRLPDHKDNIRATVAGDDEVGIIGYIPMGRRVLPELSKSGSFPTTPTNIQDIERAQTSFKRLAYRTNFDANQTTLSPCFENDWDFQDYTRVKNYSVFKPPQTGNEIDAEAKLEYNYANLGETQRRKQLGKFTLHTYNTTANPSATPYVPSGCLMCYEWDYAVNSFYNKKSPSFQMHVPRDGREVSSKSIHPKGSGMSFRFTLESEPLKDCQVLGYGHITKVNRRQ